MITGLLISLILGKKTMKKNTGFLNFYGVIETKHVLPGRMRVHVPKIIGNEDLKKKFVDQMNQLEDILDVDASTVTGSITIRYNEDKIEQPLLFALLIRLLGLEEEVERLPQSVIAKSIRNGLDSLNRGVYEYSQGYLDLWTAVPFLLTGLGVYSMIKNPQNKFPAGFTMLWWAYSAIFQGERR
jgi:hypothetical protein